MTVPGLRERVLHDRDRGRGTTRIPHPIVQPDSDSDVSDYDTDTDDEDDDEVDDEHSNENERGMADVLDVLGRFADFGAVRRAAGGVPVDVGGRESAGSASGWFGGVDDLRGEIEARLNRSESVGSRGSV
jgi:hypothetical protein